MQNNPDPAGHLPNGGKRPAGVPLASTSNTPSIDFAESAKFLTLLDADADEFLFGAHDDDRERVKALIATAKVNGKPKPTTYQSRRGSIHDDRVRGWKAERQAAGWAVTVSAQAMRAGRRLATEVAYLRVVFAEMDIGEPLQPWPLEPSIIVETSPGRYHVYWLILVEAQITEEDFHGIMMRLCETYGADPNAKDLARTMRLPGSWNMKPGREPHLVRVIHETGARYSRGELLTAFPPPPKRNGKPAGPRPIFNGHAPPGLERFHEPLKAIPAENYGDWLKVGMALHQASAGSSEALMLWDQWSAGSSKKWCSGECAEKWKSFKLGRGIDGGTIVALAEAHGYIRPVRGPRISLVKPTRHSKENGTSPPRDGEHSSPDDGAGKEEAQPPPKLDAGSARKDEQLTETTVAHLFEEQEEGHLLYEHRRGAWHVYTDGVWRHDETRKTIRAVQEFCEPFGERYQTLKRIKSIEELARSAPALAITADRFDPDPYILGTPSGHVDLRTGELLSPDPARFVSLSTSCAPSKEPPTRWLRFLDECTGGDAGMAGYLKKMAGYCLTGDVREHCLFFLYGKGRNGKGVFMRALAGVLGSNSHRAPIEAFSSGPDKHPTTFAAMQGKRLVYSSETERGRRWSEARIKDLTGGDKINARFMRQDEFVFQPAFKLIISGNYEPGMETVDDAMRGRFHVIPFDRSFTGTKADRDLDQKLKVEWPSILQWMIEGCLDWQHSGLSMPEPVKTATDEYFERQDTFTQWLEQEIKCADELEDTSTRLFKSWSSFAKDAGEAPGSQKALAEKLKRANFKGPICTHRDGKAVRIWRGLKAVMQ